MGEKRVKEAKIEVKEDFQEGDAVPAKVLEVLGRVGTRGEATQVRCKILKGRDKGKIMRRNVRGPVREDDLLMLVETELEAMALKRGRRK